METERRITTLHRALVDQFELVNVGSMTFEISDQCLSVLKKIVQELEQGSQVPDQAAHWSRERYAARIDELIKEVQS